MAGVAFVGFGIDFPHGVQPETLKWVLLTEAVILIGWIGLTWWVSTTSQRRVEDFRVLLAQGRLIQALEHLERVGADFPHASGVALYRGYTLMLLWRLEEADNALRESARLEEYARRPEYSRARVPYRALTQALLGQEPSANERLAEADHHKVADDPHVLLARLVLAVRRQDWASVANLGVRSELSQLGGVARGLSDALLEWSRRAQGKPPASLNAAIVLGEADLTAVARAWPEFAAFLSEPPMVARQG